MNFDLKVDLRRRIQRCIDANADCDRWNEYLPSDIAERMADAAAAVFDAAQSAARFQRQEDENAR